MSSTTFAKESSSLSHEIARRRVSIFLLGLMVIFFSYVSYTEGDMLVASFDDIASAVMGAIGVVIIAFRWKKDSSILETRKTNNIIFIVGLWLLVFSIFAIEIEYGFPDELADDMPKLLISAAIVANRFL